MRVTARPAIGVVVISRNEGAWLRRTVEGLRRTLPLESEITVVDDGSDDRSTEFLEKQPRAARLVRSGGVGVAERVIWVRGVAVAR